MGRHKTYDEPTVLHALVDLFAESGYEATSIDQISKATGMKRGSIYQAFGSKANLFRLALRYALEEETSQNQLADLVFVALWERASIDPDVRALARQTITELEQRSGRTLEALLKDRLYTRSGLYEEQMQT